MNWMTNFLKNRNSLLTIILPLTLSMLALNACDKDEKGSGIGATIDFAALSTSSNYVYFDGKIRNDITTSCGTATAGTTSSTDSSSSDSSSTTSSTSFTVESFWYFEYGQTLEMKFTYDTTKSKFSYAPLSTETTCTTDDNESCNSAGTGLFTCTTIDNSTCGGADLFRFKEPSNLLDSGNSYTFLTNIGTLDYSGEFTLTDDKSGVRSADLEFNMIDKDNRVFIGSVYCKSDTN